MGHNKVQTRLVPFLSFPSLFLLAAQLLRWLVPLPQFQEHLLHLQAPLTEDLEDHHLEERRRPHHHRHKPQAGSPDLEGQGLAFP